MANQTAPNYGLRPVKMVHIGTNRMADSLVSAQSASASDVYTMVAIPPDCIVMGGKLPAQSNAQSGTWILKVGIPGNDNAFGTFTVSSGALAGNFFNYGAF